MSPSLELARFLKPLRLKAAEAVVCAVSGGADSLCLLTLLHESGHKVVAMHCDHGLRGRASSEDRRAVEAFCLERGIALITFSKKLAKGKGLEERARQWRRQCYALAARECGARFVFLGHHAQDQAETLLLNLIRGAGLKGSLGMLPLAPLEGGSTRLARPFLALQPSALRAELKKRRIAWREDASNADTRFARNAVRHRVLPLLESLSPGAAANLAAYTRRQGLGLEGLDDAATRRVRQLLKKGSGSVDLKAGLALEASSGELRLKPRISLEVLPVKKDWKPEANAFWFQGVDRHDVLLRGAAKGDRMRPFGMKGSRLVFDLLAEAKVPTWKREGWPLVVRAKGGRILGVLGVRQAEEGRIQPKTRSALRVGWPSFDRA